MDQSQPIEADLIVRGRIVTMDAGRRIIQDGALAVIGDRIAAVGTADEIARSYRATTQLGNADAIVMPGMMDAHTHCNACFLRSMTAGELPMIPRIYNHASRALSPEQVGNAVRLLAAQLLRAGVTTVCEGTLARAQEEPIIAALEEVGIRCVMARGSSDQDFQHVALYGQLTDRSWVKKREGEAEKDLAHTAAFLDRFPPKGRQLIRGAITASALPGFSETYFKQASALARQYGTTMQVHVDRDREEVELALAVWGRRPIERLADMGVVDEHLVAVHAVLATSSEIRLLGEAGAKLAHSPIECVANLNAVPDIQAFRTAGVKVALGCDSQSNDMFENMRAAWVLHGGKWGIPRYDADYLPAGDLLAMATIEGAEVLMIDDLTGSLEAGKAADLVVLDGRAPHLLGLQEIAPDLIRFATRAEIRDVLVNGRRVVQGGELAGVDMERLTATTLEGAGFVRELALPRRYQPLVSF